LIWRVKLRIIITIVIIVIVITRFKKNITIIKKKHKFFLKIEKYKNLDKLNIIINIIKFINIIKIKVNIIATEKNIDLILRVKSIIIIIIYFLYFKLIYFF